MPRIGPVSDFYGAVIPPTSPSCTGIIQNPATGPIFVSSASFSTPTGQDLKNATPQILLVSKGSSNYITSDNYGFADATDQGYKIPAGLHGFYSFRMMFTVQITVAGTNHVEVGWNLFQNGILIYSTLRDLGSPPGGTVYQFFGLVPMIGPFNDGDVIEAQARGIDFGPNPSIWSGIPAAGSGANQVNCEMDFLGS